MKTRLRGPMFGVVHGEDLIVARFNNIESVGHHLAKINLRTGVASTAVEGLFGKLRNMTIKAGTHLIALSEQYREQVSIADLSTGKVLAQIPTNGATSGVEWYGQCIVASNLDSRTVVAYDVSNLNEPKLIETFDMSDSGVVFSFFNRMALDQKTGRIYGKSARACNPITDNCNTLWNSVVALDLESSTKLKTACLSN